VRSSPSHAARKAAGTVICCVLFAASCTSGDGEPAARPTSTPNGDPTPSPTATTVGAFEIGTACKGLRDLQGPQLSFVTDETLYVARPGAVTARCVVEVQSPADLQWGPEGDRLHLGDLRRYNGEEIVALEDEAESIAWSRPTGTSLVYISDGRLMKVDAFGEAPMDISFLAEHDEVVYHPAGTHVAVTGTADDGTYGLWLATNVGEDAQLLAIGEDARRIFSLSFEHEGTTLYYAAEHEDRYDVHSLLLALQDEEGEVRDAELGTIDSSSSETGDVVASEFHEDSLAYTVGSCEEGKTTRVWTGSVTELGGELAGLSTEPVGWLPSGELLVLGRESGCEGEGTLYAWSPEETTLLAADVSAAGVRAVLPPPPDPPSTEQQVIA
jgi:hypothetical protein